VTSVCVSAAVVLAVVESSVDKGRARLNKGNASVGLCGVGLELGFRNSDDTVRQGTAITTARRNRAEQKVVPFTDGKRAGGMEGESTCDTGRFLLLQHATCSLLPLKGMLT
jgi:hypothetical protein